MSLKGRLTFVFGLIAVAAVAATALMVWLFAQSAAAQAGIAEAELERACETIEQTYPAYVPAAPSSVAADRPTRLEALVASVLRRRPGVEGGVRENGDRALAYAYPTYEGGAAKTDEPPAERARIDAVSAQALAERRPVARRFPANAETLVIDACPLPGSNLSAWTMTRVRTFAGPRYAALMAGLALLLAALAAAATVSWRLASSWSRNLARIEATLGAYDVARLPRLDQTGEPELDRFVNALNAFRERLAAARADSERMAAQLAASERLAALGRVAAGVAHELRNPMAAMRLRAETALDGDPQRQRSALGAVVGQIDRVNGLVSRLLQGTTAERPRFQPIQLASFLRACADARQEEADAKSITLATRAGVESGAFDPEQIRDALVNLIDNAIVAAPVGALVEIGAREAEGHLTLSVRNPGVALPAEVRHSAFEPFVTTRPPAAGLGLTVTREIARAHHGVARLAEDGPEFVTFEIVLPCRPS